MLAESHEALPEGERMSTRRNGSRTAGFLAAAAAASLTLFLWAPSPAAALGLRSITTVTGDANFTANWTYDGYHIETDQVLLVRLIPALTAEAKYTRTDSGTVAQSFPPSASTNMFTVGPVVNFTDTTYAIATYGLGFDSASTPNLIHEVNASLNWETDLSAILLNVKWSYFTSEGGSWYVLPSLGGRFHVLPALGAFGEFFISWNSAQNLTGAFWGEADYAFSPLFTLRGGFTLTMSLPSNLGFSTIAGADFSFSESVALKYKFAFLYNVVEYQNSSQPNTSSFGIENLLSLDVKL
jgi:hypothetical protein